MHPEEGDRPLDHPTTKEYKYTPLEAGQFRLLALKYGDWDEPLRCVLCRADRDDVPLYDAMSYAWGDSRNKYDLLVQQTGHEYEPFHTGLGSLRLDGEHAQQRADKILKINEGCYHALRRARTFRKHLLWIDAVCINQADVEERNQQVAFMHSIFSWASRVLAYIGEHAQYSAQLFEALQQKTALQVEDSMYRSARWVHYNILVILNRLFSRPWFGRMWMLQEVALAKDVVIICGESQVSRDTFETILSKWNQQAISWRVSVVLPVVLQRQAWHTKTVLDALQTARPCAATDPRDKFYALKGLFPVAGHLPKADYNESIDTVYGNFAVQHLERTGSLEVLSYVQSTTICPSWVPDWRVFRKRTVIGDPGSPFLFHAGGSHCETKLLLRGQSCRSPVLRIAIVTLAPIVSIHDLWSAEWEEDVDTGCFDTRYFYADFIQIPESRGMGRRAQAAIRKLGLDKHPYHDFDVTLACTDRCLYQLSDSTWALAPAETEAGDMVCIVLGARTPFVLRRLGKESEAQFSDPAIEPKDAFSLIGECIVTGVMYGEALQDSFDGKRPQVMEVDLY